MQMKLASGFFAGIIKLKGIILKTMEEWNQFMKNMANLARNSYRGTEEYVHYKYRREEIDRILDGCLMEDQKEIVDTFLQELDNGAQREAEVMYIRGMTDSVEILKMLGVLA